MTGASQSTLVPMSMSTRSESTESEHGLMQHDVKDNDGPSARPKFTSMDRKFATFKTFSGRSSDRNSDTSCRESCSDRISRATDAAEVIVSCANDAF
jgi:hypothetical protein